MVSGLIGNEVLRKELRVQISCLLLIEPMKSGCFNLFAKQVVALTCGLRGRRPTVLLVSSK